MNEQDFDTDNLIKFKESGFIEVFDKIFSEKLSEFSEPATKEIYEEIVENYFILIKELGVGKFNSFRFVSYDYCREIIIDGKEYDLDNEFSHDDLEATEALCAIDCLIADSEDDEETVLKNTEKRINTRSKR